VWCILVFVERRKSIPHKRGRQIMSAVINQMVEGISKVYVNLSGDDVYIGVGKNSEDKFVLYWNDYVANEWTEVFDTLPIALLRLAALLECGRSDWEKCFSKAPSQFVLAAECFLEGVVT